MKRDNIDYEYANNKINSQLSLQEKLKHADFIIDNNLDINNTINQINNILKQLEEN
jgi:dephospho-CoA kinase